METVFIILTILGFALKNKPQPQPVYYPQYQQQYQQPQIIYYNQQ